MIRIGKAAKMLGITPQTLRKWVRDGKIEAVITPYGHFFFDESKIRVIIAGSDEPIEKERKVVFYIRSSSGQKASLETQERLLTDKFGQPHKVYKDTCSGLKDSRRGLNALLDAAKNREFTHVAITHPDRLTRFGMNYLKRLFSLCDVELLVLNERRNESLQDELMKDFMSLIASFSGKFYRLRGYEQQKQLLDKAKEKLENVSA